MIKLFVSAKPKARENRVEQIDETHFRVWIKEPPDEGRANQAILTVLSEYLKVPKTHLSLLRGHKAKNKIVVRQ
ncbi:MAG: DUF167 domain-containing protein [Candidatus Omnitrophica bacterium]|nr:DUF167 domain-containing protein [Candidatus Omnitrophota bacterium]